MYTPIGVSAIKEEPSRPLELVLGEELLHVDGLAHGLGHALAFASSFAGHVVLGVGGRDLLVWEANVHPVARNHAWGFLLDSCFALAAVPRATHCTL